MHKFYLITDEKSISPDMNVWIFVERGFELFFVKRVCKVSYCEIIVDAWIAFETEDEMAIFKLTYL